MNTKLALSAIIAALMLTACAKQEAVSTDTTPAEAPAAEAVPADDGAADAAGTAEGPAEDALAEGAAETPPAE